MALLAISPEMQTRSQDLNGNWTHAHSHGLPIDLLSLWKQGSGDEGYTSVEILVDEVIDYQWERPYH